MSLFVTGTDTEVGKTVVSAIVLARYARRLPLGYWKPLATGTDQGDRDLADVSGWVGDGIVAADESYLYGPPVSPHLAARKARRPIDLARVLDDWKHIRRDHPDRQWVVEGVGGLLVPLNDDGVLLPDLLRRLKLPSLLVTRSTLGTINHTLLTLEAMRRRRLPLAGVVMVGPKNRENRRAIEGIGGAEVIAEVPWLDAVDAASVRRVASRFDRSAVLRPLLSSD